MCVRHHLLLRRNYNNFKNSVIDLLYSDSSALSTLGSSKYGGCWTPPLPGICNIRTILVLGNFRICMIDKGDSRCFCTNKLNIIQLWCFHHWNSQFRTLNLDFGDLSPFIMLHIPKRGGPTAVVFATTIMNRIRIHSHGNNDWAG